MGAYLYYARSPRLTRTVEIEWEDGTRETAPVCVMAYLYKPSWYGPLDRELRSTYGMTMTKLDKAWIDVERPKYAAIAQTLDPHLKRIPAKVRVNDQVIDWPMSQAPVCVRDDPNWGNAKRFGKVVSIPGPVR